MSEYKEHDNEDRILEWEIGLPNADDLTPLSQLLIPPELASAFKISPEPPRTISDVNQTSQTTLSNLRNQLNALSSTTFKPFDTDSDPIEEDGLGSESKKMRKVLESEEADSDHSVLDPSNSKSSKRPRLVWTPQLHKRFVEVVNHLGIKTAVPKTIMQMMNVEGLTRENVASHLQKYRLYVKRMQGLSSEGNSGSDQLFGSTPLPPPPSQNCGGGEAAAAGDGGNAVLSHGNGHMGMGMSFSMPYHMMPMPVYGHNGMHPIHSHHGYHQQHHNLGFDGNGNGHGHGHPNGNGKFPYNGYGSLASYPPHPHRVTPNDNML